MDMRSRRQFVNSMMMAAAASPMLFAQQGAAPGGAHPADLADNPVAVRLVCRVHTPAGIVWVSGQGSNDGVPNADHPAKLKLTDPYEDHCKYTMEALKRSIERLGGTMSDFLYMQVFFCLPLDDSTPTPTGSAAAAAYLKCYNALSPIYGQLLDRARSTARRRGHALRCSGSQAAPCWKWLGQPTSIRTRRPHRRPARRRSLTLRQRHSRYSE